MSLFDLPFELLSEITDHLVTSYSHGSLASLNQTSRHSRDTTISDLYRTLILLKMDPQVKVEEDYNPPIRVENSIPEGWQHTR